MTEYGKNRIRNLIKVGYFVSPPESLDLGVDQASTGRQRPSRPGFLNSLFPFWDSCFVSEKFPTNHEGHGQKQGICDDFKNGNLGDTKVQDGEDVHILISPGFDIKPVPY